ncbi:MAG: polyprenyl diphosphate synthase, partial [Oscillospiraceae bacterium]|nr:polyprenyl diphosphate synthase [Oscillospiraceae bacterium]
MAEINELAKGLHIGIIMDGNGRWAKKRGLPRTMGHKRGAEVFQDITRYCNELGVQSVTYYAFSTENWRRPENEVESIMRLFKDYLIKAFDYKKENNRVVFLGDRTPLKPDLVDMMNEIEEGTKHKTGMTLNIAVNYGGRAEIVQAVQKLAEKVQAGQLAPTAITEEMITENLYTAGQKEPDFILRPSGEKRISNFLLWQCA